MRKPRPNQKARGRQHRAGSCGDADNGEEAAQSAGLNGISETWCMDRELPIRVRVIRPPVGVTFAIQRGKDELLPPSQIDAESLVFDLSIRVSERKAGGAPNVLGPYAQGKPDDRFLYLNSGTMAGQKDSCWTRRAKIKTAGIDWKLIEQAFSMPGAVFEVQIDGNAKDGGPCCATVPLLNGGWKVCPT